ncbi:hypothetical protein [Heyndrickxia oleronia]|uniref:hypothetical protein n=1 Tax=Heyndrickxia oleronia TaxID=38875 RepID=UPI0021B29488|nr:hypothetical protein [Heyndrickxia oleronia]
MKSYRFTEVLQILIELNGSSTNLASECRITITKPRRKLLKYIEIIDQLAK